jgi:GR25 family glycosyltransferase involved in LPS biosynthesis
MSIILDGGTTNVDMYGESVNKDGYLDGIDVIYYINLDRSIERQNHMERILNDSIFDNIPTFRIPAYDGKNQNMNRYISIEDTGSIDNSVITNVEYACTMSHLYTIKQFSESQYDIALIFEDDVTLEYKKYWKKSIKNIIENAPDDWEIIQLATIVNNISDFDYFINNEFTLMNNNYSSHKSWSTAAYIINKKAAKKINQYIYKNNKYYLNNLYYHNADTIIYTLFKTYFYNKPYFTYITDNTSTIHQQDVAGHIQSKNIVTNYLNNIFSKNTQSVRQNAQSVIQNAQSVTQNADASIIIQ